MVGDGTNLHITHSGSVSLPSSIHNFNPSNVLCVPIMKRNLLSVSQFCRSNNVSVEFLHDSFSVKDLKTRLRLLTARAKDGVYAWPTPSSSPLIAFACSRSSTSDWHSRLGHPSSKVLGHLVSSKAISVLPSDSSSACNACLCNKSTKLPFSESSMCSYAPLQLIYSDVWCAPVSSIHGHKYYLIFVDHFTRYIWLYPLIRKSDVAQIFLQFQKLVEKFFDLSIKQVYTDNGGEYAALKSHFSSTGISHLTTPPHTPEHNGFSERRHRHIVETRLTLLRHTFIPLELWSAAFSTVVYLINRMPKANLSNVSSYHRLFKKSPNYTKLRVFGCLCYPWLRPYSSHKMDAKSKPCVFLGYSLSQSVYHCLDPTTNRLFTSRHVKFIENVFPYKPIVSPLSISSSSPHPPLPVTMEIHVPPPMQAYIPSDAPSINMLDRVNNSLLSSCPDPVLTTHSLPPIINHPPAAPTTNQHCMVTRAKSKSTPPLTMTASLLNPVEPTCITKAMQNPLWRDATSAQYNGSFVLKRNWMAALIVTRFVL